MMQIIHYTDTGCTSDWLNDMRTIEGDPDVECIEFVSYLKPRQEVIHDEETEEA